MFIVWQSMKYDQNITLKNTDDQCDKALRLLLLLFPGFCPHWSERLLLDERPVLNLLQLILTENTSHLTVYIQMMKSCGTAFQSHYRVKQFLFLFFFIIASLFSPQIRPYFLCIILFSLYFLFPCFFFINNI